MPPTYVPQMVNLEVNDMRIVRQAANRAGLGEKGFSAALRIIIREWAAKNQVKTIQQENSLSEQDMHIL